MIKTLFKKPITWFIIIPFVVLIVTFIIVIIPNKNKNCPNGQKIYDYCGDNLCRPICEVGSYNCKTGCSGCPGSEDIKCGDTNCCNPANCKTAKNGKKYCCAASQFCPTSDDPSHCCDTNEICDKTTKKCVEICGTDSSTGKPVTCDEGNTCIEVKNMNQDAQEQFLKDFKSNNPRVDNSGNGFVCAKTNCKTELSQFPDAIDGFSPCSSIINKSNSKDFGYCTSSNDNHTDAYDCWEKNTQPNDSCTGENCIYKSIFNTKMSEIQADQNTIFRESPDVTQKNLGNWCGNNNQQILQFKKSEKSANKCTVADCWDSIKDFENVKFVNFDGNTCTAIRDCDTNVPVDFVKKVAGKCDNPPDGNFACKEQTKISCNPDGSITDVSTDKCTSNNTCYKAITAGLGWCLTSSPQKCLHSKEECDDIDDIYLQSDGTEPHDENLIAQCGCGVGPAPTVLGLVYDDDSGKLTCTTPEIKYDKNVMASCSGTLDIVAYTENRFGADIIWTVTRTGTGDDVLCNAKVGDTYTVRPFSNKISYRNADGWYIVNEPTFSSSAYTHSDTFGTLHLSCPQVDENAYFVVDFRGPYTTNGDALATITPPAQDSALSKFTLRAIQADYLDSGSSTVINILFVFYPTKLYSPPDTKY